MTTVSRQLMFDKNNRRLHFKPAASGSDDDTDNYASKNINRDDDDDEEEAAEKADEELLRDFDIIDVIPGFGEPPRNNQEFEIKNLRRKSFNMSPVVVIKEGSVLCFYLFLFYLRFLPTQFKSGHFLKIFENNSKHAKLS
jgi:hypothetical protein